MIFEVPSVSIVSPTSAVLPRRDDDGGDVAFCKNCINVFLICDASSDYFQVGVSERFCHSLGTAAALRLGHLARRASQGNDPLSTLERLISDLCTSQTTRPENGHLHVERQSSRTGTGGRTQPRRRMQRRKGSGAGS